MTTTWKGVFPAVATQIHEDLSLDLDLTAKHVETLIASGVSGLVMLGSLGENAALASEEKKRSRANRGFRFLRANPRPKRCRRTQHRIGNQMGWGTGSAWRPGRDGNARNGLPA